MPRNSQYRGGSGTNPSVFASGETVSQAPAATMIRDVRISGQLARLWMNGILLVRMIWMINVWVKSDSTNQPVWNRAGSVSYTHLRAHETRHDLVCRLLLEKKKKNKIQKNIINIQI